MIPKQIQTGFFFPGATQVEYKVHMEKYTRKNSGKTLTNKSNIGRERRGSKLYISDIKALKPKHLEQYGFDGISA